MQELLSQQDIKTVHPLSVRMIFEDNHNWDAFSLANKDILRDVEIKEVKKMMSCIGISEIPTQECKLSICRRKRRNQIWIT